MPNVIFRITCPDEIACKEIRSKMEKDGYDNKKVRGNHIYDHIAKRNFSSWKEANEASNRILQNYSKIVGLTYTQE